jgi:hypothetical protein
MASMTAPQANNAVLARSQARGDISRIASEHASST